MRLPGRTVSLNALTNLDSSEEAAKVDNEADELFTRNSVVQVKEIQRRLRNDVDAKQEELRLMVGERYRDLLQASTSIISIHKSSENVLNAIDEMKETVASQEIPSSPLQNSPVNKKDSDLQIFQSLGAHMKLLLDAPEHLWRLIERREYYRATWLFLLSRGVHRALTHDDATEESGWEAKGISIADQFPLVQRQWETVAQFRPQISHKATLSLREPSLSPEQICATLLTLYLLDSRPLAETLAIFFAQRSRILGTVVSKPVDAAALAKHRPGLSRQGSAKKIHTEQKDIRQSVEGSLDIITRTVAAARTIFQEQKTSGKSFVTSVLENIQPNADPAGLNSLPPELRLSTQLLLLSLPSSSHFLLLPQTIKSYKPYVDLTSTSSTVNPSILTKRLQDWYQKSCTEFSQALHAWFSKVNGMKEMWKLRNWIRKWLFEAAGLLKDERSHLHRIVDDASRRRLTNIWTAALKNAKSGFEKELRTAVDVTLRRPGASGLLVTEFQLIAPLPPLQSTVQLGPAQANASLKRYKAALRRQVDGRTPLLEVTLSPLEACSETLHKDLRSLKSHDDETRLLVTRVLEEYRPEATSLSADVFGALRSVVNSLVDGDGKVEDTALVPLVFVVHLAEELSIKSPFITNIGCEFSVAEDFRAKTRDLHKKIILHWRAHTVAWVTKEYWRLYDSASGHSSNGPSDTSLKHSSALMHCLLSLSAALQQLGVVSLGPQKRDEITREALYNLVEALVDPGAKRASETWHCLNLLFGHVSEQVELQLSDVLARTQILLAFLFPSCTGTVDKASALLRLGKPSGGQEYHPAVDVVKPSPRLGLLLVQ
ncbi:hypothetical protein BDM02DRAFT_3182042 [Thelephora ganbajun]|uniref:Uncharacterized protein n=1 Tax=Thelephora ganbajun TaxID=370292 RepID=A0ACB6ZWM4_THEGA|nr:hypothetical protein BDM02DRAFT_3182042 [Thelephora ganbajun]